MMQRLGVIGLLALGLCACKGTSLSAPAPTPQTPAPETPAPETPAPPQDNNKPPVTAPETPSTRLSFNAYDSYPLNDKLAVLWQGSPGTVQYRLDPNAILPSGIQFQVQNDGQFRFQNILPERAETTIRLPIEAYLGNEIQHALLSVQLRSDPLFFEQWHLNNTGQKTFAGSPASLGFDLNIQQLHYQGFQGQDVRVAVVDSGLEIAHDDLKNNLLPNRSWSFVNQNTDPSTGSDHGTAVAGIIAAEAFNQIGGRGVAPSAKLLGFDWTQTQDTQGWVRTHGGDLTQDALVINESFGYSPTAPEDFTSSWIQAQEAHLAQVTQTNNQGRGVLLVKAAGNSFKTIEYSPANSAISSNITAIASFASMNASAPQLSAQVASSDADSSSFYHTVVSALSSRTNAPLASYSSVGASVWVSAFGGEYGTLTGLPAILTTDLMGCDRGYARMDGVNYSFDQNFGIETKDRNKDCKYSSRFNGTSAATPMVSGVAALLFAANPKLSYRDVRHILAATAKKIDPDFVAIKTKQNYEATPAWISNAAGFHFHNWYGFGLVDASAALSMATDQNYRLLPALKVSSFISATDNSAAVLPDNGLDAVSKEIIYPSPLIIEAVQVKVSIDHNRDSDIGIEIISPSGTRSVVLQPQSLLVEDIMGDTNSNFNNSVFLTNAFYGENAQGNWTVKITDTNSEDFNFYICTKANRCITEGMDLVTFNNVPSSNNKVSQVELRFYGH